MRTRATVFAATLIVPACLGAEPQRLVKTAAAGVVVEEVTAGSAADKAGIHAGDVILNWARASAPPPNQVPATGTIVSPFTLLEVEAEQAARGIVTLVGRRDGLEARWTLPPGRWDLKAQPSLSRSLLIRSDEAKRLAAVKDAEGARIWRTLATEAQTTDGVLATWLWWRAAAAFADAQLPAEAHASYAEMVTQAARGGSALLVVVLRERGAEAIRRRDWNQAEEHLGHALDVSRRASASTLTTALLLADLCLVRDRRGEPAAGEDFCREAIALQEALAPHSLDLARSLHVWGNAAIDLERFAVARDRFERALAIKEKLVPASLEVASEVGSIGIIAHEVGDLEGAEAFFERALVIQEKLAPNTRALAATLGNLGNVALRRGDLARAQTQYKRSSEMFETLAPASLEVAAGWNNLALIARERGDLEAAEAYHQRALELRQTLAPDSILFAKSLNNLGVLVHDRGDLQAAEDFYRRALSIQERLLPDSLELAASLGNLGTLLMHRGDLKGAEEPQRRALAIREKQAPGSLDVAISIANLGQLLDERGELAAAAEHFERALAMHESLAPGGLDLAITLGKVAGVARRNGDLERAGELANRRLTITRKLAPGSTVEAESFHELGLVYQAAGKAEAADVLCQAVDALEQQKTKIGGTQEAKTTFGAKYADYYRDCLEALTRKGQPAQAFGILERSRARALLSMLAERDLVFSGDVPADLDRERRLTDVEYERVQDSLSTLNPAKDAENVEPLLKRLRELRAKQEEIGASIRRASPHFASLRYPEPLDLDGVRTALDAGTILLAYSVGTDKTLLFVVQPPGASGAKDLGLTVLTLPVGEQNLRARVEAFRDAIQQRDAASSKILTTRAGELYDLLVKPADRMIAGAERILISPDGPLHTLPFAALVREDSKASKGKTQTYLIEWKPLHTVVSATVYAELQKARRAASLGSATLVAFGDPKYATRAKQEPDKVADAVLRSAVRGGSGFEPLPSSRIEVENIARLYSPQASVYLGGEATEERVKATGKDVRYLHFATHGLLNERFPLDSALVLTIPERPVEGQDNGLLQAWEIFEKVRVDADLVTLSACETGLGKELGGEGLVGLTRAFQYAGARSVLASLWSVSDQSTADLMQRFYAFLNTGKTKDEALRAAQVDLIRSQAAAHPFHWAAFQLFGDWK